MYMHISWVPVWQDTTLFHSLHLKKPFISFGLFIHFLVEITWIPLCIFISFQNFEKTKKYLQRTLFLSRSSSFAKRKRCLFSLSPHLFFWLSFFFVIQLLLEMDGNLGMDTERSFMLFLYYTLHITQWQPTHYSIIPRLLQCQYQIKQSKSNNCPQLPRSYRQCAGRHRHASYGRTTVKWRSSLASDHLHLISWNCSRSLRICLLCCFSVGAHFVPQSLLELQHRLLHRGAGVQVVIWKQKAWNYNITI